MSGGVDTTKLPPLSLAPLALALAFVGADAGAETVHLPLTGLLVDLPDGPWAVTSHWSPSADPFEPATGSDVLEANGARYEVMAGGRTDRPCPLANPFVIELDEREWIHDPTAHALCRLEHDARLEVRVPDDDVERHRPVLSALAQAFEDRRVPEHAPPPLRDARVTRDDGVLPALAMPTIGLTPERPDDGFVWRVAHGRDGRYFDALVRVFPTFPEVQLLVYRHAKRDIPSCAALAQRQVARGPWHAATDELAIVRKLGRFTIVERCGETADALIETRIASRPRVGAFELAAMLANIDRAAWTQAMPDLPPTIPARDFSVRWATAGAGVMLPEGRATRPYLEGELGLSYVRRNGIFVRGVAHGGGTTSGAIGGGSLDLGIALGADPELTLVLALGVREDLDPILENRTLTGTLELYSGFNQDRTFAWALRFIPFHVASRQPAVGGAPLAIAWDGIFPWGLMVGFDLRWVDRPLEAQPGWIGSGVVVGLRIGFGDILR